MAKRRVDIEKLNTRLREANQQIRIESADTVLRLNNGKEMTSDDRRNFLRRVRTTKHDYWIERIDRIYGNNEEDAEIAVAEVKSAAASIGGKGVWEQHRESLISQWQGREPPNKGKKMNPELLTRMRKIWTDPEYRKKCSEIKKGDKNPMYGKSHSEEYCAESSRRMKNKILKGEFTPNSNNRNTHWDAEYLGRKYRSSWEALYHAFDPEAKYEEVRIPYCFEGKERIYIVDFVNHYSRKLVEVKPRELAYDKLTQAKFEAARKWALDRGYDFVLADQGWLAEKPMPNLSDFDQHTQEKITKFYEAHQQTKN